PRPFQLAGRRKFKIATLVSAGSTAGSTAAASPTNTRILWPLGMAEFVATNVFVDNRATGSTGARPEVDPAFNRLHRLRLIVFLLARLALGAIRRMGAYGRPAFRGVIRPCRSLRG